MQFEEAQNHILHRLERELSPALLYHSRNHTIDVIAATGRIAEAENIVGDDRVCLLTAAAYHDSGFLEAYKGHEEVSCRITREVLPQWGYTPSNVDLICSLIEATKVPTHPQTHLEEVLCDADSDYLGRPDFFTIGKGLFKEFIDQNIVCDEESWNRLQISYLESHHYYTSYGIAHREPTKKEHLKYLQQIVAGYSK